MEKVLLETYDQERYGYVFKFTLWTVASHTKQKQTNKNLI